MVNKYNIKILRFLRDNKTEWFSTQKIWRNIGDTKVSYSLIALRLKYLREKDIVLFNKHRADFKGTNALENVYKYKTDALDELIVNGNNV